MTDTPDEIIEHRACFCTECGKDVSGLPFELFGKRQVIDIPTIKQVVTEHRVYRCKCTCGNMIVFIHGLFMNPASWETWIKYFEEKGYKCHAPAYPFHEAEPSDLRTNINPELGKLTFG
jgi:pimeloyl-ACP methyl ester carboxylesterase